MMPKQLFAFLNENEKGILVNSSDGVVRTLVLQSILTQTVDLTDPNVATALGELFTSDRAAAFQAYAASLPAPGDPTAALIAAGFTQAQAAAIVGTLGTILGT